MIITENINSQLTMPLLGLDWEIDFTKPFIEVGKGKFSYEVMFFNVIEEQTINKNHRILQVPFTLENEDVKFSLSDLKAMFYAVHPYLFKE